MLWWVKLGLVPLVSRAVSKGVFGAIYELNMILGSLSGNR